MQMAERSEVEDELEAIVDHIGLSNTIEALATVCVTKATHLKSNWQDAGAARPWTRLGLRLDTVATAAKREGL
jgi:hypothetical protein